MTSSDAPFPLLRELTSSQNALYAYIFSLVPDREAAQDILQETNLVICEKADEYKPGTRFLAWACTIARYKALAFRRRTTRDRHVFGESTFEQLAVANEETFSFDEHLVLLEKCLEQLSPKQRDLIRRRYQTGATLDALGAETGYAEGSLGVVLHRIRRRLLQCLERNFAGKGAP